jgi:hypothetical protein
LEKGVPMFDTLAYASKLKEAGLTEKQAAAHAEALVSVVDENLATKTDLELVRRDIKELELKFEGQFALMKWMMGVVIAGIISLILKAFFVA